MRKLGISLAVMALMLSPLGWQASTAQTAAATVDRPQARVIVKFKADSAALKQIQSAQRSTERAALMSQRVGLALTAGNEIAERMQVVTTSGVTSEALAERLSAQGDVEYAVPDRMRHKSAAPNDALYADGNAAVGGPVAGQWYLRPPNTTTRSAIDAETAWDITTGSPTIVVADIDTGVRFDHPDLKKVADGGNLLDGYDMISNALVANDGTGRDSDPSDPGDSVTQAQANAIDPTNCTPEASSWHGTQTAGLIGALTNNGIGMASVGRTVQVLPVRVLGRCGGFDSDIIAGMRWAAGLAVSGVPTNTAHKARVLNLSLGGEGACTQAYSDAITEITAAGSVIVVSAGNSGLALASPANCAGVIAVGGLRHFGSKVGYSDLGPGVTISAPAGNQGSTATFQYPILTTSNSGTVGPGTATYTDGLTHPSFGTSFSSPLVAGTAALILSVNPALTPVDVRNILTGNARPFPTSGSDSGAVPVCQAPTATAQNECYCTTATCGAGMLDAKASVLAAAGGLQARVAIVGSAVPTQPVQLDGSTSLVTSPATIATYQWTLTPGGVVASLTSPTNASTVTTSTPTGPGTFTITLRVTDSASHTSTVNRTITVAAPAADGGGGGGGALGLPWLAGLLAGILALQGLRRRGSRAEVKNDA